VDGRTIARGRRAGLDPERSLAGHDSTAFFARAGGGFRTGPTGTNVADWMFGYVAPARRRT
jgi:glycerate-2-kinase